jgi:hypothetical protein
MFTIPYEDQAKIINYLSCFSTCRIIDDYSDFKLNKRIIALGFRPIADEDFIEMVISGIDNRINGKIEITKYYATTLEEW